jgi:hypothetical protein
MLHKIMKVKKIPVKISLKVKNISNSVILKMELLMTNNQIDTIIKLYSYIIFFIIKFLVNIHTKDCKIIGLKILYKLCH